MAYEIKRYALVRGNGVSEERVSSYLPANYRVVWSGRTDWLYYGSTNTWKQVPGMEQDVVMVEGRDKNGFTLEYIRERLGSGLFGCDELDLSHPLMKEVPDHPSSPSPPSTREPVPGEPGSKEDPIRPERRGPLPPGWSQIQVDIANNIATKLGAGDLSGVHDLFKWVLARLTFYGPTDEPVAVVLREFLDTGTVKHR